MNPATVMRAARLTVVQCTATRFHVVGGTDPHIVVLTPFNPPRLECDCRGSRSGATCSHKLATQFYITKAPLSADRTMEHGSH